jgi:thioredoxin
VRGIVNLILEEAAIVGDVSVEITEGNFEETVAKAPLPVLVDFWAPWCGPCRTMGPVLEEIGAENSGRLTVGKVNVDDHQELAARFNILSIPTLLLFSDGQVVKKLIGALPKARLLDELAPWLGG